MKRISAVSYYLLLVLIPLIGLVSWSQTHVVEVSGDEEPDWWTICHRTTSSRPEDLYYQFVVDRNSLDGSGEWDAHQRHEDDLFFEGKNVSCPKEIVTPTPTEEPEMTPTPTEEPEQTPTPTSTPELTPTDTPVEPTATPKVENGDTEKDVHMEKDGPTCEERDFTVTARYTKDGEEVEGLLVQLEYMGQELERRTNANGIVGGEFSYAGEGKVRAEADGYPDDSIKIDELICDGASTEVGGVSENGQVLGYASTGSASDSVLLLIESMGLLTLLAGAVGYLKFT